MTEFIAAVHREFGVVAGDSLLCDVVLSELGGITPQAAVDEGWDVRTVWLALCHHEGVPEDRQWGPDIGAGDLVS